MDDKINNSISNDTTTTIVDETTTKKSKFTIVKNVDLTEKSPSKKSSSLLENETFSPIKLPNPILLSKQNSVDWDFDTKSLETDFEVNNARTDLPSDFNQSSSKFDLNSNSEDDDVFNESLPFTNENTNPINFRENEGQDTITSLSNNIYLKQLAKIRKKAASVKSSSSRSSLNKLSTDETNPQAIDQITLEVENEPQSASPDKNASRTNLRSLFKNRGSFTSRQSIDTIKLENQPSLNKSDSYKSVLDISQLDLSQNLANLITNPKMFSLKDSSLNVSNPENDTASSNVNKSEQVFNVLKEVIDSTDDTELSKRFIQQVLETVKTQQRILERKKDKEKKACFVLEMFVFFTIFLMSLFLFKNVIIQLQIIDNKNLKPFTNTTFNNNLANYTAIT